VKVKQVIKKIPWKLVLLGGAGFGLVALFRGGTLPMPDFSGLLGNDDDPAPGETPTPRGGGRSGSWRPTVDSNATFQPILFASGSTSVHDAYRTVLANVVRYMRDHPTHKLQIDGFSTTDGSTSSNLRYSQQRAEAVKQVLTSQGVSGDRITTTGRGETQIWGSQSRRAIYRAYTGAAPNPDQGTWYGLAV
jgi:outer membrane protein OmpA-like peptidoglycan-associated protein